MLSGGDAFGGDDFGGRLELLEGPGALAGFVGGWLIGEVGEEEGGDRSGCEPGFGVGTGGGVE